MEPLRTVIFVDGRNFKYNLQAFRFQGEGDSNPDRYYSLDEKHFDWREFFLGVVNKFTESTGTPHRLVRAYWYNAETIRPYEVTDRLVDSVLQRFGTVYPSLTPGMIRFLAKTWYDQERRYFEQTKETVFEGIQRRIDFLEFKYVGEYVVKPFDPHRLSRNEDGSFFYQGTREGEKGVDVGIAIDMIAKLQAYDVAVLVSGDADFLPAVRHLKDSLRLVYQFSLALFENCESEFRNIHTTFVGDYSFNYKSAETVKRELTIANPKLPNPATFLLECEFTFPQMETLIPVAKEILINYITE